MTCAFPPFARWTLPLFLAAASCVDTSWDGEEGQAAKAKVFQDVLLVDAAMDGSKRLPLLADTGSPIVMLSPDGYGVPPGVSIISGLRIGGLTFSNLDVMGANLLESPDPATPIGGIVGCTVLCQFATSFDYRGAQLFLGGSPAWKGVEKAVEVPFQLEGGGLGLIPGTSDPINMPPSRIVLDATIEGTSHTFVVDTGASIIFLRHDIYDVLAADHRGQLTVTAETIQGASSVSTMRLRSVSVGGAEVQGAPASTDESIEALLDSIEVEIGGHVDGLIGGTFLREFLVTIDYPATQLVLRRYTTRDHIVDSFLRVGITLAAPDEEGRVRVDAVLPNTDAATKGVTSGDEVTAVDGKPVGELGQTDANALLTGALGAKHALTFGVSGSPSLDHQTASIAVDDLLPLP